jgi:hypothetical protein
MLVAGGGVGAVTVIAFATDLSFLRGKPDRPGVHVVPVATGTQVGVAAVGRW